MGVSAAFLAISRRSSSLRERDDPRPCSSRSRRRREAVPRHDVEDAGREDLGLGELREPEQRERRVLGRLDHHGVSAASAGRASTRTCRAGSSRGRSGPRRRSARAEGCSCTPSCTRRRRARRDAGTRGEEPGWSAMTGISSDIVRRGPCAFSDSRRPSSSMLLDEVRHPERCSAPLPRCGLGPGLVVGLLGGGHGSVDVGRGRLGHLGDHVPVGGLTILRVGLGGVHPLAADVHLVGLHRPSGPHLPAPGPRGSGGRPQQVAARPLVDRGRCAGQPARSMTHVEDEPAHEEPPR